jgi:hypothetical protein
VAVTDSLRDRERLAAGRRRCGRRGGGGGAAPEPLVVDAGGCGVIAGGKEQEGAEEGQPFFIGDGLRVEGITLQEFEVPAGATRLFLGVADPDAWASNGGAFDATVEQEVADTTQFCTAKVSSKGCLPQIGYSGYPTLDGGHAFDVFCSQVSPGQRGTLFYGRAVYNVPFQGGYLCTNVLIKRTPIVQAPAGSGPCASSFSFDFNAWILSGNDPTLIPGETIYAQWWMRDSGAWSSTGLSDAIEIQLCQ